MIQNQNQNQFDVPPEWDLVPKDAGEAGEPTAEATLEFNAAGVTLAGHENDVSGNSSASTIGQQREAQIQEWLGGRAEYVVNEKGEKHLVLTERQVESAREEMRNNWRSGVTEENAKEITEFISTPGKLEAVPWIDVRLEGGCITCDGPFDVKSLMSKVLDPYSGATVGPNDTFFIQGCGSLSLFVYKGESVHAVREFSGVPNAVRDFREKFSAS